MSIIVPTPDPQVLAALREGLDCAMDNSINSDEQRDAAARAWLDEVEETITDA
jgi:hypothetical protein